MPERTWTCRVERRNHGQGLDGGWEMGNELASAGWRSAAGSAGWGKRLLQGEARIFAQQNWARNPGKCTRHGTDRNSTRVLVPAVPFQSATPTGRLQAARRWLLEPWWTTLCIKTRCNKWLLKKTWRNLRQHHHSHDAAKEESASNAAKENPGDEAARVSSATRLAGISRGKIPVGQLHRRGGLSGDRHWAGLLRSGWQCSDCLRRRSCRNG